MEKVYTLTTKELASLLKDSIELELLYQASVDNWSGTDPSVTEEAEEIQDMRSLSNEEIIEKYGKDYIK